VTIEERDNEDLPSGIEEILAAARLLIEGGAVTELGGRCDGDDLLALKALLEERYGRWYEAPGAGALEGAP